MASFIFESTKSNLIKGELNFENDTFDIYLLDNTIVDATDAYDSYTQWGNVSAYEISATGDPSINYTPKELSNVIIEDFDAPGDTNTDQKISADNINYTNSTITASCAVITKRVGVSRAPEDLLVMALDIRPDGGSTPLSSVSSTMTINLDSASGGFLVIK